jgi:uncharacterized membrane protein YgcG
MSIITNINGIPLFTTIQEAIAWGNANGLSGYHAHNYQGQQGYMGGSTHNQATGNTFNSNQQTTSTTSTMNFTQTGGGNSNSSSGGGGGYGGGY